MNTTRGFISAYEVIRMNKKLQFVRLITSIREETYWLLVDEGFKITTLKKSSAVRYVIIDRKL
jgi:hypothetical protein